MFSYLIIFVILGLIPWIIGKPWTGIIKCRYSDALAYGIGYFLELALFHIISFPLTISYSSFHSVTVLYSISLLCCCLVSVFLCRKRKLYKKWNIYSHIKQFQWYEWILIIVLIYVIGIQIVRGITYDLTYISHDDATYTVIANDVVGTGQAGTISYYTGEKLYIETKRASQTSLYFPAYLSLISNISVVIIEHTIQYIHFIILAYTIYLYMSGELFYKLIDRLAFLLILAVFYIYGYHSHYSLTFRLLGANYQGKAVLAVSLTPLILSVLIRELNERYKWQTGLLLLLLSLAAVSLSLWGTGTAIIIISMPIVFSLFRKERNLKHLIYILWGCIAPVGFVLFYLSCSKII